MTWTEILAQWFAHPAVLAALLVVPALAWLLAQCDRRRSQRARRVLATASDRLTGTLSSGQRRWRRRLLLGGGALAIVALAAPLTKGRSSTEQPSSAILICLDVSTSMLARDLQPDRLERARRDILELLARASGERMGIVVFAGEARLLAPLTTDLHAVRELTEQIDTTSVVRGGTDLGAALEVALTALEQGLGAHRDPPCILVLTDGEDHEQRGAQVATACRNSGVVVHCVGYGTATGGKIVIPGPAGESYLRDQTGADVVTRLDPASLAALAKTGNGVFAEATQSANALLELYERRILTRARRAVLGEVVREHRFQIPLAAALLCWLVALLLTERRLGSPTPLSSYPFKCLPRARLSRNGGCHG